MSLIGIENKRRGGLEEKIPAPVLRNVLVPLNPTSFVSPPVSKLLTGVAAAHLAPYCPKERRPDYVSASDSYICANAPFSLPLRIPPYDVRYCPPFDIDTKQASGVNELATLLHDATLVRLFTSVS